MSEQTRIFEMEALTLSESPGLSEYLLRWWSEEQIPRPSALPLHRELPEPRSGSAWGDAAFGAELAANHQRLGASPSSLRNLEALAQGAPCVITGQQPAVLGGPLYCAWKLSGAVGLAESLSARWNRPVVPVFWSGGDDSDFDEARRVWIHRGDAGAWQASLAREHLELGHMVGALPGMEPAALEDSLRQILGTSIRPELEELLAGLPASLDLGDRIGAALLRLFAESGVVIVDARSKGLRRLGRPLFAGYLAQRDRIAQSVDARGAELEEAGLQRALHPTATRSGLFAIRNGRREKLKDSDLDSALESGTELSASVLLRPLVQDALLAPVAAVLGPSELHYHAQLAPAYEILEVDAAAPAPRAHLCLLPPGVELPADPTQRRRLLAGGEGAREVLAELALPSTWTASTETLRGEIHGALFRWREAIGEAADAEELEKLRARLDKGIEELARRLAPSALELDPARRRAFESLPELLAVRGTPQERAYASWMGWQWLGDGYRDLVRELGRLHAADVMAGNPSLYCTTLASEGS